MIANHKNRTLDELQRNAWLSQIRIPNIRHKGHIYLNFADGKKG